MADPASTIASDFSAIGYNGTPQAVDYPGGPPVDLQKRIAQQKQQPNIDQITQQPQPSAADQVYAGAMRGYKPPTPIAPPKLQDYPAPPQQEFRNVFKEASPGLVFATVLGTLAMRQNGMGAMAAATGFLNGFHEGDKEKMENNRQKWQDSMEQLERENELQDRRYKEQLEYQGRISQVDLLARLGTAAASLGDPVMSAAVATGDMSQVYNTLSAREKATENRLLSTMKYHYGGSPMARMINEADDEMVAKEGRHLTSDEIADEIQRARPARSPVAYAMQAYVRNHPKASSDQIIAEGAKYAGYMAAQRWLAVRGTQLSTTGQELLNFSGPALAASERVPREAWVPVNVLELKRRELMSDPDLRELSNRTQAVINAYAQIISRTGTSTVFAQQRAAELLKLSESQEAYERGMDVLINEANMATTAPREIRQQIEDEFLGRQSTPEPEKPPASSAAPSGKTSTGIDWRFNP